MGAVFSYSRKLTLKTLIQLRFQSLMGAVFSYSLER